LTDLPTAQERSYRGRAGEWVTASGVVDIDLERPREEPEPEKEPPMKVLCLLRRHKWRVDNSDPKQPFEVCDRCGHYRNDDSFTDLTGGANMRGPNMTRGPGPLAGGNVGGW
jgi:hypothetical protein